jgi:hypothetical protein
MAPGELKDRAASGRERDNDRWIDSEMVEQQRVSIRLVGRHGLLRQRRAEIAEARRADDPEPRPGEVRPPAVDGVDVASQDAM